MKKKWNITVLLLCTCVMCVGLTGCEEKAEHSETLSIDTIKNIVIKTGDNDIIVESIDADEMKASIVGYEETLFVQEGDTVRIELPMSKGGVHLNDPPSLHIYVPSNQIDSFTAASEYGDIQIKEVMTNITIHTEFGGIAATGLQGTVTAKTQSGEITSDSISASDIIRGAGDVGASYFGILGNSTTEDKIDLSSEYGNIDIK